MIQVAPQAKLAESTSSLAKAVKSASGDVIAAVGGPGSGGVGSGSRQQGVPAALHLSQSSACDQQGVPAGGPLGV